MNIKINNHSFLKILTWLRNCQSWHDWGTDRADRTEERPELTELRNCQSWQNWGTARADRTEELWELKNWPDRQKVLSFQLLTDYWLRYWQKGQADIRQLGGLLWTAADRDKNVNDLVLKQLIIYWLYMLIETEYKWLKTETINYQLTTWIPSKCLFSSLPMLDLFVDCTWIYNQ